MQNLNEMLRATKVVLSALTLISVGVLAGLLLSTTLPDGLPQHNVSTASVAAVPAATQPPPVEEPGAPPRAVPQELTQLPSNGQNPLTSPFVEVARRVVPAVVSVESSKMIHHPEVSGPQEDLFRRMFPNQDDDEDGEGDGTGDDIEVPSSGSGFIIDASGHVFTNDHVVSGSENLTVSLADGRVYDAWLVGTDPLTDVAVVKIDLPAGDPGLPTIKLGDSDEIRVGDWSIAVGNPLGELEGTLTVGVVSAKERRNLRIVGGGPVYQDFIQTDASINFGNSGGPLVNARGEAIGINSAVNPTGQGLGFAIPINMARRVGIELIRTGTVRRGYLGILPQEVTEEIREAWDMSSLAGILVGSVEGDTPAERAGLEVGDVILEFNQTPLPGVPEFRSIVAEAGVGVDVPIVFLRDGEKMSLNVVLDERPDTPAPPRRKREPVEGDWLGATMEDIDSGLVDELNLAVDDGIVVTELDAGGAAARGGLRVGDVILEVNRSDVATMGDLDRMLESAHAAEKPLVFLVRRGTTTTFVSVRSRD